MMTAREACGLIEQTRRLARKNGWRGFAYGVVLRAEETPDGLLAWRVTTRGGEQLWLTNGLAWAATAHYWWLQGRTTCQVSAADLGRADELCDALHLMLYHAPLPGRAGADLSLTTESILRLSMDAPVILLSTSRPAGWPL